MKHNLTLVMLNAEQIAIAKDANGQRKKITHAVICGPHGQMFGTEKQCLKYWSVWDPKFKIEVSPGKFRAIFPVLFDRAVKAREFDIRNFTSTFNLVTELIRIQEERSAHG